MPIQRISESSNITSNSLKQIMPIISTTIFFLMLARWLMWVRSHMAAQRQLWKTWANRDHVNDAEFLKGCGIEPNSPHAQLTIAIRQAFADAGGVHQEAIRAEDLIEDHFWDSIDWLDVVFRIEKAALVKVPKPMWDNARELASKEQSKVMVKHIVRATCDIAKPFEDLRSNRSGRKLRRAAVEAMHR
jgi:acyl carrier protein